MKKIRELQPPIVHAADHISCKYGSLSQTELLKSVYHLYSWYATKSEWVDLVSDSLPCTPAAVPAIYTIGYEGKSVDALFDHLLLKGIEGLIDVRSNP